MPADRLRTRQSATRRLLIGAFTPLLMLLISVPLAALLVTASTRWLAAAPVPLLAGPGRDPSRTPWWTVAALVAVAVAFGVDQAVYHSQQIIVQRDPALASISSTARIMTRPSRSAASVGPSPQATARGPASIMR